MGQQEKKGLQWGQKQHWGQKQQMLNLGPCKGSKVLNSWYQGRARGVLCGGTGCAPHTDRAPSTPVILTAASPSFHPRLHRSTAVLTDAFHLLESASHPDALQPLTC